MSRGLPPLDLHAHIDLAISVRSLEGLGAVVFAATRSLDEYERVMHRTDAVTVWGLGCHPGIAAAQDAFDAGRFRELVARAPFVGEVGLDGSSSVSIQRQIEVFDSILTQMTLTPRLISVHSKRATARTLEAIERTGVRGVILHWWLGSQAETTRALELGCLFSVNQSMDIRRLREAGVEVTRLLPETDHPTGNRRGNGPHQPGWTIDVETLVAGVYGMGADAVRERFWDTLAASADRIGIAHLLPPVIQAMISQARKLSSDNC